MRRPLCAPRLFIVSFNVTTAGVASLLCDTQSSSRQLLLLVVAVLVVAVLVVAVLVVGLVVLVVVVGLVVGCDGRSLRHVSFTVAARL